MNWGVAVIVVLALCPVIVPLSVLALGAFIRAGSRRQVTVLPPTEEELKRAGLIR